MCKFYLMMTLYRRQKMRTVNSKSTSKQTVISIDIINVGEMGKFEKGSSNDNVTQHIMRVCTDKSQQKRKCMKFRMEKNFS